MAARFQLLSKADYEYLSSAADNENTKKSTNNWIRVYKHWANERGVNQNLEELDTESMDEILTRFYAEIRKPNGQEYEPDSLRVMQGSINRYLVEKGFTKNIINDQEFVKSRKVLEGKAKLLRQQGMGKKRNASTALEPNEEEILWTTGKLGDNSPNSLVRTMWFMCTQHFGLRGCQEHCTMRVEDFILHNENGVEYVEFKENPTKTRQGGLKPKQRATNPKMFSIGGEKCPVRLFKLYLFKRPLEIQNCGRFYLTAKKFFNKNDETWYTKNPMGKNTISGIMKALTAGTELSLSKKKFTNHSMRKTTVKKLKAANIPESSIIKVTGHSSTKGLSSYDPGDEEEIKSMSKALNAPSTLSQHNNSSMFHQSLNQPVNIFHGCTVNFHTVTQKVAKRSCVIYSSESSQSQE